MLLLPCACFHAVGWLPSWFIFTVVSYDCKGFITLATGGRANQQNLPCYSGVNIIKLSSLVMLMLMQTIPECFSLTRFFSDWIFVCEWSRSTLWHSTLDVMPKGCSKRWFQPEKNWSGTKHYGFFASAAAAKKKVVPWYQEVSLLRQYQDF